MAEKFTLEQLKQSKKYKKYGYILNTEFKDGASYTLAEVDKRLAKYINKE